MIRVPAFADHRGTGVETDLIVECHVAGAVAARTHGDPDRCYPGEPASVEFGLVRVEGVQGAAGLLTWDEACALYAIDEDRVREAALESDGEEREPMDHGDYDDNDYREDCDDAY